MKTLQCVLKRFGGLALMGMLFCVCLGVQKVQANNVRIIGIPELRNRDTASGTVQIWFDVAWDNSWRTSKPDNHDAIWIFVKCWDGEEWNHVYLNPDVTKCRAGSKELDSAVNKGKIYKVTSRDGEEKQMGMTLTPGYSMAWKKWHLDPTEDSVKCCVGFFLHRTNYGAGDVMVPGVKLNWDYKEQGFVPDDDLVVKVFVVEMVYVPTGAYYLGGKGTAASQLGSFTTNGETFGTPLVVTSENAITVANDNDPTHIWASGRDWAGREFITAGEIPADFPKGYKGFYIMKYELTQEAYCEFLNTLSQGQQDGRIEARLDVTLPGRSIWDGADNGVAHFRNYVEVMQAAPVALFGVDANNNGIHNEVDTIFYRGDSIIRNIDGQDLAMNIVSARDLFAYAEFACLRPMTELEYEKACRGPRAPASDEYAWGSFTKVFFGQAFHAGWGNYYNWHLYGYSTDDFGRTTGFTDINTGTEKVGPDYNVGYTNSYTCSWWGGWHYMHPGPLRVGIFADTNTTRASAGATYWGVMNMSDNVSEICISVYDESGRKFVGTHGCGQLDAFGAARNTDWHMPVEETDRRYVIARGMIFHYNATDPWGCCCHGDRGRWNLNRIWWDNGATPDNDLGNAGMISARHRATQEATELNQRDYWSDGPGSGNWIAYYGTSMQGIRCVRTAGDGI